MNQSTAIETEYKGYLFRSRLEARWAVFFDAIGIDWKYETEGYEVGEYRYLPDFWLPAAKAWVEVKGDKDGLRKDIARMLVVLGTRTPLPGFVEGRTGLILLHDVPDVAYDVTVLHPYLSRASVALDRTWGYFAPTKSGASNFVADHYSSWLYALFGKHTTGEIQSPASSAWSPEAWLLDTPGCFSNIRDAYRAARQARFEHGANGL
jgi:hypothetical protein